MSRTGKSEKILPIYFKSNLIYTECTTHLLKIK